MMMLDLSVARLNGLVGTVGGGLGVDGAMGTGSPSEAWYEPAEFVGKGGQRDARMNMLAVQNTSVNGGEITPDDAERVSVENLMGTRHCQESPLTLTPCRRLWRRMRLRGTNGLRASAEEPCNS